MDEPPKAPEQIDQPSNETTDNDEEAIKALLAEGDEVLLEYHRNLAQQLNESIDALTTTFEEVYPIAATVHQSMGGLSKLVNDAETRSRYLEWWWFVTDGGLTMPHTPLGKLWFAWQYRLFTMRRKRRHARARPRRYSLLRSL